MTLAIGEFIGALLLSACIAAFVVWRWGVERAQSRYWQGRKDQEYTNKSAYKAGYDEGRLSGTRAAAIATRATIRDSFSLLPRLHCSRSISGHVRVSDVERMLAEGRDG